MFVSSSVKVRVRLDPPGKTTSCTLRLPVPLSCGHLRTGSKSCRLLPSPPRPWSHSRCASPSSCRCLPCPLPVVLFLLWKTASQAAALPVAASPYLVISFPLLRAFFPRNLVGLVAARECLSCRQNGFVGVGLFSVFVFLCCLYLVCLCSWSSCSFCHCRCSLSFGFLGLSVSALVFSAPSVRSLTVCECWLPCMSAPSLAAVPFCAC